MPIRPNQVNHTPVSYTHLAFYVPINFLTPWSCRSVMKHIIGVMSKIEVYIIVVEFLLNTILKYKD